MEDVVDYLWTRFKSTQAIEHLINGILKAKDRLKYTAGVLPFYNEGRNARYIQVDNMDYIIVYIVDEHENIVNLIRLAHYLQKG